MSKAARLFFHDICVKNPLHWGALHIRKPRNRKVRLGYLGLALGWFSLRKARFAGGWSGVVGARSGTLCGVGLALGFVHAWLAFCAPKNI